MGHPMRINNPSRGNSPIRYGNGFCPKSPKFRSGISFREKSHGFFIIHPKFPNRPFYSCVLSVLAWIESEAGVDLALIETSLLFLCKCN